MLRRILLHEPETSQWLEYRQPVEVLVAARPSDVLPVLVHAEHRVESEGLHAAGFVSFAAAPGFDPASVVRAAPGEPLVCLGLFGPPRAIERPTGGGSTTSTLRWRAAESFETYVEKIAGIKRQIAEGNTYQINYTLPLVTDGVPDPWELFLAIGTTARFGAYLDCGERVIVSASPELFFRRDGSGVTCQPMKGTARRGSTQVEDLAFRNALRESRKCRAENIMITDMIRNDLGRVAIRGSVQVPAALSLEKYPTVWQMTSTVTAQTQAPTADLFSALFPCASVTGAPKISSLALIAALEDTPRGVYTGAVGRLAPGRQACFSVAIRTAVVDRPTATATYGVGGGIVWDSDAREEYDECLLKARILGAPPAPADFRLLETMLWTPAEGVLLFDEHLARLGDSAGYFDFPFDRTAVVDAVAERVSGLPAAPHRLRLLWSRLGEAEVTASPEPRRSDAPVRLRLAPRPVDSRDPFLFHKTTHRAVYEQARQGAGDCDDVLLWNADGEVTETTIANVVVRLGESLYTPPVACGLLEGTMRRRMLESGQLRERRIRLDELAAASEILLLNSVRGVYRALLVA